MSGCMLSFAKDVASASPFRGYRPASCHSSSVCRKPKHRFVRCQQQIAAYLHDQLEDSKVAPVVIRGQVLTWNTSTYDAREPGNRLSGICLLSPAWYSVPPA